MIPKIIHRGWLSGDAFAPLIKTCIDSWKDKLPDYTIKLWDTNAIDVRSNLWLNQAFLVKKYAFAADYIRFYALYHYGGIYLDADVEVIKSFDNLLDKDLFLGEESGGDVEAAVIGVRKGVEWIKECLDYYEKRPFIKGDGSYDMRPVPLLINEKVKKYNIILYPYTFFSPKDYNVGKINVTDDTYCIHHFDGKWIRSGFKASFKKSIHSIIYFVLGRKGHNALIHKLRKLRGK